MVIMDDEESVRGSASPLFTRMKVNSERMLFLSKKRFVHVHLERTVLSFPLMSLSSLSPASAEGQAGKLFVDDVGMRDRGWETACALNPDPRVCFSIPLPLGTSSLL
jgi:hypothetical protein